MIETFDRISQSNNWDDFSDLVFNSINRRSILSIVEEVIEVLESENKINVDDYFTVFDYKNGFRIKRAKEVDYGFITCYDNEMINPSVINCTKIKK